MALFSKFKDMYRLQKQAKTTKHELKNIHIEAEDEFMKVTVSGEQEIISLELMEAAVSGMKDGSLTKDRLQEAIKKVLNRALKKAQEIAAEKTKNLWKELGIGK